MILLRWQDPSDFATSARQYAAFVQLCCRQSLRLHLRFVASARISAMLVQPSAKNIKIAKLCGNARRRAFAVRRRAEKLPNLVPFEKLPRHGKLSNGLVWPITALYIRPATLWGCKGCSKRYARHTMPQYKREVKVKMQEHHGRQQRAS